MKKREILSKNNVFMLVRQQRDHKTWYEIQLKWYHPEGLIDEVSAYFAPPAKKHELTWRFWNRLEANRQFMYATLRWC